VSEKRHGKKEYIMAKAKDAPAKQEETTETVETPAVETPPVVESETSVETVAPEQFERRFSQFKADTKDDYIKELEKAYDNSLKESTKLAQQSQQVNTFMKGISNNPELAAAIETETTDEPVPPAPSQFDPLSLYVKQRLESEQAQEYQEFAADHPELDNDPETAQKVLDELRTFAEVERSKGRLLGMKEGLTKAYISLGLMKDNKEEVAVAAKEIAASSTAESLKKSTPKVDVTDAQLSVARKMFRNKKDGTAYSDAELAELLAKYKA